MKQLMRFPLPSQVQLGGLLGQALDANHSGRLAHFITDASSPAIALFDPQRVQHNHEGDWYGEHAGKWLYAAARAANRTADPELTAHVRAVADYLVSVQEPNGYLGTYAPSHRFMQKQPLATRTWDGAPSQRTWDIWTHSYLVLGLLEVHKYFPSPTYVDAARRIGDLCWHTLTEGGIDITRLGNHHGMSATVLLDAAVELFFATKDGKYLELAKLILKQADERTELQLLSQAVAGVDASEIGTGKAYQLCWNLVGLTKLQRATGDPQLLKAVRNLWESIRQHHLTLGGGPWGGVAHRSREVFNHHTVFSPYGYVETCSVLAWVQLNRELLSLTGDAQYAEEIERTAFNDLIGAQAANGEDWCYYSFPNGKRVHTTYWRCCKSSGAMAVEELPSLAYGVIPDGIAINIYGPSVATLPTPSGSTIRLEQVTEYPFEGRIRILIQPQQAEKFALRLRIPSWAERPGIRINGIDWSQPVTPGGFASIERMWAKGDEITLLLPMRPVLHRKSSSSVQESRAPDGEPIHQEVMHYDYVAISRGPLVYATGLVDGFKSAETIRLVAGDRQALLEVVDNDSQQEPAIRLNLRDRAPLLFVPYYVAGGRADGAWRLTWMPVAP